MAQPRMWPRVEYFDPREGLDSIASESFTLEDTLKASDTFDPRQSFITAQDSSSSALFADMPSDYMPYIEDDPAAGLNQIGRQNQVQPRASDSWSQFSNEWNSSNCCIAGTMNESGKRVDCVCDKCYEVCPQEAFHNSKAFKSVPQYGSLTSATGEQSTIVGGTGLFQQLGTADFGNFDNDDIAMLDQASQTEMQLSSSPSSSGTPWIASSGNGSSGQEGSHFFTPEGKRLPNNISLHPRALKGIQGRNNPRQTRQDDCVDSSNSSSQSFSSPAKSLEDAYQRLEINCAMLPNPNELQKWALSIISGLSIDRVQAFYAQKHHRAASRVANVAQSQETQSLLGIQTVNKEDINFSDSAYYSHSSCGSSGAQNCRKVYEFGSASVLPDEQPSKPSKENAKKKFKEDVDQSDEISKRFECTWRGCGERFRSKRDWKRHEESIHCQQNTWKCPVNVSSSKPNHGKFVCGREFKRDDKFREHLRNVRGGHGYDDFEVGTMVDDVRQPLFPASQFRKECGFCGQSLPTWEMRIDHIADEYTKKGKNMSMWKDPWPRGGGFALKRNDDDDGDGDDDDDDDNSRDVYGQGDSLSDKSTISKTERKDRRAGGGSQRRDQITDGRDAANHRSRNNSSAVGPTLCNVALCYRIKQQATADFAAVMVTSTSGSSDDHLSEEQGSHYIPRVLSHEGNNLKRRWSKQEAHILEQQYQERHKPTSNTRRQLAERFHVDTRRINNWFRNRRATAKQEKKQEGCRASQNLSDSCDDSMLMGGLRLSQRSAFRSPKCQTVEPVLIVPNLSSTETALSDVVNAHTRRIALTLADIDRGLSGANSSTKSSSKSDRDGLTLEPSTETYHEQCVQKSVSSKKSISINVTSKEAAHLLLSLTDPELMGTCSYLSEDDPPLSVAASNRIPSYFWPILEKSPLEDSYPHDDGYLGDLIYLNKASAQQILSSDKDLPSREKTLYTFIRPANVEIPSLRQFVSGGAQNFQIRKENDTGGVAVKLTPNKCSRIPPNVSSTCGGGGYAICSLVDDLICNIQMYYKDYKFIYNHTDMAWSERMKVDALVCHLTMLQLEEELEAAFTSGCDERRMKLDFDLKLHLDRLDANLERKEIKLSTGDGCCDLMHAGERKAVDDSMYPSMGIQPMASPLTFPCQWYTSYLESPLGKHTAIVIDNRVESLLSSRVGGTALFDCFVSKATKLMMQNMMNPGFRYCCNCWKIDLLHPGDYHGCSCYVVDTPEDHPYLPLVLWNIHNYHTGIKKMCDSSLRIIRIKGSSDPGEPLYYFKEAALESFTSYEALSYAWGCDSERVPLSRSGHTIIPTTNLSRALQTFLHKNQWLSSWIVLNCMNQADRKEGRYPIEVMHSIELCQKERCSALSKANNRPRPPCQHKQCIYCNLYPVPEVFDDLGEDGDDNGACSDAYTITILGGIYHSLRLYISYD